MMFKLFLLAIAFALASAGLHDTGGFPTAANVLAGASGLCVGGWFVGLLTHIFVD